MAVKHFNLPDPGEGLVEAEIVTWKVKVGDLVKVNHIIVEIETAKSLVELPVPYAGTVTALLVSEGDTVPVGTPIISVDDGLGGDAGAGSGDGVGLDVAPSPAPAAPTSDDEEIEAGKIGGAAPGGRVAVLVGYGPRMTEAKRRPRKGASGPAVETAQVNQAFAPNPEPVGPESLGPESPVSESPVSESPVSESPVSEPVAVRPLSAEVAGSAVDVAGSGKALAKPPVRKLAKDRGVDLSQVTGSGEGGIVTRADLEAYATGGSRTGQAATAAAGSADSGAGSAAYIAPVFAASGEREVRIPIKGVRKMTAQAMVGSAFTAPHVTEFITVDVTRTMRLVERLRTDPEFRDVKVSPLLVVAKALIIASRRNPGINATWDEAAQEIVVKNYVNLGIAAATPRGLMVPNIKDADKMSLRQLADAMTNLVAKARVGKTQPAEMSGGSITITNVGVFGVDTGTPILNPGEAAILCFGAVRQMPWVVKGKIKPRWVTQLGLSFDHRLVDGDLGSRFLADIAAVLQDPSQALVWS
jgi:2-oxoisovalerate dehydrogenase E2 component (dihydrolipoyl transacylase)